MKEIYYRMFYYVHKKMNREECSTKIVLINAITCAFLLSFMILMVIGSVVFILKWYCGIQCIDLTLNMVYLISAVLFFINCIIFLRKKRYATIIETYNLEDEIATKKKSNLYFSLFLLLTFSLPIVGFIYLFAIK